MKAFLESFRRQLRYSLIPRNFGEPKFLAKQKEILEKKYDLTQRVPEVRDLYDLLIKIKDLWKKKGSQGLMLLSGKEKNWIPWTLYLGEKPRIVDDVELLKSILNIFTEKRRNINKLIHVYLKYYEPKHMGTEIIRKSINEHLHNKQVKSKSTRIWKYKPVNMFSSSAIEDIAKWILNQEDDINTCIEKLGLTGDLASCGFLKEVSTKIIEIMSTRFPYRLELLQSLLEVKDTSLSSGGRQTTLRAPDLRFPELLHIAANLLLPKAGYDADPEWKKFLRPFFLKHLGDPRLPGGNTRWKKVTENAVSVFKRWLSQKDLEFFFNLVELSSGDPKWVYRRKFWEAYIPYIENTWIALGRIALSLSYNPEMQAHMKDRQFGVFKEGTSEQSVFLIEMGGYVFIEWSHGGACRIWRKEYFPLKFGQKEYRANMIRSHKYNPDYKLDHRGSEHYRWQDKLENWIQRNIGIRPQNSFIVER